jgi:nitrogen fixation NifU-like protein
MLGIPLSPVRLKCAILGLKVLEGGIIKYEGGSVGKSTKNE